MIVAGKKRAPAKPWASALPACEIVNAVATANRARLPLEETSIGLFLIPERGKGPPAGELSLSAPIATDRFEAELNSRRWSASANRY